MDGYPEELSPDFENGRPPSHRFDRWWERVQSAFPTVPMDAAKYWLYEHWGQSPYGWLPSRQYDFVERDWPLERLKEVRSTWCGFSEDQSECIKSGNYLLGEYQRGYETPDYMRELGYPPARLVLLDNRDGHLADFGREDSDIPSERCILLVEGFRRFNLSLALHERGKLQRLPVWVMTRRTEAVD